MSSAVVCDYTGSGWELNSQNENSCQVYAKLQGKCDPTFVVSGATSMHSPPYQPPNNACGCNPVAYNLMGGCSWCQNLRTFSWLTVNQWAGNCTMTQYNSSGISASVSTSSIDIPAWAYVTPTTGTWSPAQASMIATSSTSTPYIDNPTTGGYYDYGGRGRTTGIIAAAVLYVVLWIVLSILGCGCVIGCIAHYQRQTLWRRWYVPTATYHLAQRGGYAGVYGQFPYATPGAVGATASTGNAPRAHPSTGYPAGYVPSNAPAMANLRPGSTVTAGFQSAEHITAFAPPAPQPESNYQVVPSSPITARSHAGALGLSVPSTPHLDSTQPPVPVMRVPSGSKGPGTYHALEEVRVDTTVYPVQEMPADTTGYPVEKATPSVANVAKEKTG